MLKDSPAVESHRRKAMMAGENQIAEQLSRSYASAT